MESSKPWYYRVIACACAVLICTCLVVFAFMIPPKSVKATSIYDQWEDWVDDHLFEGSSFWIEEIVSKGVENMGGELLYIGILGALNMIESPDSNVISLNSLGCLQGYYNYNGSKHLCQSVYRNDNYSSADGGISVAYSDDFQLRCIITATTPFSFINCHQYDSSIYRYLTVDGRGGSSPFTRSITGGGSIFPDIYDSSYGFSIRYETVSVPNFTDNMVTGNYVKQPGYTPNTIAGGFGSSCNVNINDPTFNPSFTFGNDGTIPDDQIIDFVEDFNIYIVEQYPDIDPDILFVPVVIPDESSTDGSGCNCNHNIYVDVTCYYDPEINVYVTEYITITNNVDIELPSEWVQDYTLTTDPYEVETIPFPTQENSEPVTMPTLDVEDYEDAYGNAIDFWFYVAQSFIEKLHLQLILAFAFALSVVGFVLWKLGGGGKE